jgi:transcription elongation GreA/GreB family factor
VSWLSIQPFLGPRSHSVARARSGIVNHDANVADCLMEVMDVTTGTVSTEFRSDGHARVTVGSVVMYRDEDSGEIERAEIVPHAEADFTAGRISSDSPLARALLRRATGDPIRASTPGGVRRLRIVSIDGIA